MPILNRRRDHFGTINSMTIEDFCAASGLRIAVEHMGGNPHSEGHITNVTFETYAVVLWVDGQPGEIVQSWKFQNCKMTDMQLINNLADNLLILENSANLEDYMKAYPVFSQYPELAEAAYRVGKSDVKRFRRLLGEWYEILLYEVKY